MIETNGVGVNICNKSVLESSKVKNPSFSYVNIQWPVTKILCPTKNFTEQAEVYYKRSYQRTCWTFFSFEKIK